MNARVAKVDELLAMPVPFAKSRAADDDAVDTRALVRAFWQKRWLIGIISLATGILTYIFVAQGTPTYSAQAKMMLDIRKTQIVTSDEILSDVDLSEQTVNSELAVLRSNLVIDRVIERLDPALLEQPDPANQPVPLVRRVIGGVKGLLSSNPDGGSGNAEAMRHIRLVNAIRDSRALYSERDSYVMVIQANATDAYLAQELANATAQSYIDLQLANRRKAVEQATGWLEERLAELSTEVENAETAIAEFRAQALLVDGATLENVTKQLFDLNTQLITASSARVEAEVRLNQLITVFANGGVDAAARIVDTPGIQSLRATEIELRQTDATWARPFSEDQAKRVSIRRELEELRAVMAAEVEGEIQLRRSEAEIAGLRENGLRERITGLDEQVVRINANQLDLKQLERHAEAARNTYESLLTRVSEARAQRELQQADAVLIERAVAPQRPSSPRPKMFAMMAMFVAFAGASSWVFFREVTPTTFRGARELEGETGLPVIASLPKENWARAREMLISMRRDPFSGYADRIRQIRTALTVRLGGKGPQSVLIMSSAPGEGKSTTSLALAQMAELAGSATIVIDCDLRRPQVAEALQISDKLEYDFADFIANRCALGEAIYQSDEFGFDVLASRGPHRDAADALSENWLRPMLDALKGAYDLVVIDAPALLAVPDAMALVREVDNRLYVVAFDDTPRAAVHRGLAGLSELGVSVAGMILNRVDTRRVQDAQVESYGYEV